MPRDAPRPVRRMDPVHVVGLAATPFLPEQDAMLDELVFDVTHAALRECGLRKPDVGLSVMASMDILDGRSISSGLYTSAAAGYLSDGFRIEGDSGLAIKAAAEAVAAGDVEVAVAVGVHNPETRSADAERRRAFLAQVSNLGFEPHFDRPVGLTAEIIYALHAAAGTMSRDKLAALAAEEICRGSRRDRSVRAEATVAEVLASGVIASPLSDLMLPAYSTGAVAVVLASPARAGRCVGRSARITGIGHATGGYTWDSRWLSDPSSTTSRAAAIAYAQAGIETPDAVVTVAELSAPTPALHHPYLVALGLTETRAELTVNASGGLRSNFPGLANGALRLLEVVDQLESSSSAGTAVAHSVDSETGLVSEDVSVMVVEAA